ncbi:Odorant receptor 106, partial [Halyomorpha halys]
MSLQFETTHSFLIRVMRRSGLMVPWVRMDSSLLAAFYFFCDNLLVLIGFYQFIFSVGSIVRIGNFQDMCTLGIVIAVLATGVMLSIFYIHYQQRLEKFINNWDNLNTKILNGEPQLAKYFQRLYLEITKSNETFAKRILFIAFWTPFIYCSPVPIIDVIKGSYRTNLPLPILFPYDDRQPGLYEFTFCLHVFGLLISVMKKIGNDCFFLGLFKIHSVYLRYLSESIKDAKKKFANNDWFIRRKQIEMIKLHTEIIRNAVELVSIYTPIIVIYYGNLIIIVVFGLFTQIKNDRDSVVQGFGVGGFCLINIFQLYMMSSSAEELASE